MRIVYLETWSNKVSIKGKTITMTSLYHRVSLSKEQHKKVLNSLFKKGQYESTT